MKKLWRYVYLITFAIFLSGLTIWGTRPNMVSIDTRVNGGLVSFAVDRQTLLHPRSCVNVRWHVDGIENVFFDDLPTVGESGARFCPHHTNLADPMLYVDFRGNFIQTYTIPLTRIYTAPALWLPMLAFVIAGLWLFAPRMTLPPIHATTGMSRRELLSALGVFAAFGVLSAGTIGRTARDQRHTVIHHGWVLHAHEAADRHEEAHE